MPIVHLESGGAISEYLREYPAFPFQIGALRFSVTDAARADWLAMVSNIVRPFDTVVPKERRIMVMREPSGHFPAEFVNQFGILASPWLPDGYRGRWHRTHGGHSPFFGVNLAQKSGSALDYRALMGLQAPEKLNAISAVLTRKSILPGHRRRLRFVRKLQTLLGDRLQIFGRGFREIGDKADAILPYQYHLVLENTSIPDYWTEKLADAFLGYAFPIVSGPPNLDRWFPPESFESIDIDNPSAAADVVIRVMDTNMFHHRTEAVRLSRQKLMQEERLCHVLARVIGPGNSEAHRLAVPETIRPASKASPMSRARREVARLYWQSVERLQAH